MTTYMIRHYAHEVVEALPIRSGTYACRACGLRGNLHLMFHSDCDQHGAADTAGWRHPRFPIDRIETTLNFNREPFSYVCESFMHMDGIA